VPVRSVYKWLKNKKPEVFLLRVFLCREGGIRTPGPLTVNGFQDRRNRPLCHLSNLKQKYAVESNLQNPYRKNLQKSYCFYPALLYPPDSEGKPFSTIFNFFMEPGLP
jgi:hypothetical protein